MRAELKRLHSPDVEQLNAHQPEDAACFSIFVQAMVGPAGEDGEESFDFVLCTPSWLSSQAAPVLLGEHHLIVHAYDYGVVERFISDFCAACEAETWDGVALKLSALGRWEFERYAPSGPQL